MKKTDKFKGLFLKAGEFIKTKKGYCVLAVILMIFLAVFLSGIKIETVSEHNRKQMQQAEERKSMLAQIEKEESSGEDTQSTTGNRETSQETTLQETTQEAQQSELTETGNEALTAENDPAGSAAGRENASSYSGKENTGSNQELTKKTEVSGQNTGQAENRQTESSLAAQVSQGQQVSQSREQTAGTAGNSQTTQKVTQKATQKATQNDGTQPQTTTEEKTQEKEYFAVSIKISCEKVLNHPDLNTTASLPQDGIILETRTAVKKGQTVFDALDAACTDNQVEYVNQASGYGAYISEIAGLKEKQCGKYSGWKYKVNGVVPGVACSSCELHENDVIEWYYAANYSD